LYTARKREEIGDSLQFIIRKLHIKVVLQTSEQIERLQAVDPESLEKVIVGRELFAGHFEVRCSHVENFV